MKYLDILKFRLKIYKENINIKDEFSKLFNTCHDVEGSLDNMKNVIFS